MDVRERFYADFANPAHTNTAHQTIFVIFIS